MNRFSSYDGTVLAYHERGDGTPLICVPGGPGGASSYLGDLGGLDAHHRLILLDNRGTGDSAVPSDPGTYQAVRLVDDVEALRLHLGLDRVRLLGHSAGANVAMLYAARHPDRVERLLLITPSWRCTDIQFDYEEWYATMRRRSAEPWYDEAFAAVQRLADGDESLENRLRAAPLFYGRWNAEAAANAALNEQVRVPAARDGFGAGGQPFGDPSRLRPALREVTAPVLVLGGGVDPGPPPRIVNEIAAMFPNATVVIQPDAGHSPWLDDPAAFTATVDAFLS